MKTEIEILLFCILVHFCFIAYDTYVLLLDVAFKSPAEHRSAATEQRTLNFTDITVRRTNFNGSDGVRSALLFGIHISSASPVRETRARGLDAVDLVVEVE